ncbi:MAG TPA: MgtC/SapB family protein [Vicinamibacterales bacterium]|nr:MgtC/SapB family protein [Vicinamibacterales bacterium]
MPRDWNEVIAALISLPLASLLGTVLALRPRRRGTPPRSTAVVQTQIVLAVVGAVIMLVVGASLARAFGIVGAASLIRYRSKISDPKDAVVMLSTLSIGLASGVGLYFLATFSTLFLMLALWIIESFEPQAMNTFTLSIKAEGQAEALQSKVEAILRRHRVVHEVRTLSDDELSYEVQVAATASTDPVVQALAALDPKGKLAVEWAEQKKKEK